MADLDRNGIEDDEEALLYKERASASRFRQQLAYGAGAAMVFGLATALSSGMVTAAKVAGLFSLPTLGLVALGIAGVGLLYLSARFLTETTFLDQQMQAKQIHVAKSNTLEPTRAQGKTQFPSEALAERNQAPEELDMGTDRPLTTINRDRQLMGGKAMVVANDNAKAANDQKTWVMRTAETNSAMKEQALG